jgi:hypothetical protein
MFQQKPDKAGGDRKFVIFKRMDSVIFSTPSVIPPYAALLL